MREEEEEEEDDEDGGADRAADVDGSEGGWGVDRRDLGMAGCGEGVRVEEEVGGVAR